MRQTLPIHRFFSTILFLTVSTLSWANGTKINGIYYVLNSSSKTVSVTYTGTTSDYNPSSTAYTGSITIPSTVTYNSITYSVTSIGGSAFYGCSGLTSVTIPNSVTSIGEDAFQNCIGMSSVTIPNSVTSIGSGAFSGCSGLTSVTIGSSVTSIGYYAFSGCSSLTSITLNANDIVSKTYTSYDINLGTIFGSQVKEYVLGDDVKGIGDWAFYKCSGLTSVTIGNSVTSIGSSAFSGCSGLTSVTIPNSVTSISGSAFSGTAWYNNQPDGLVYAGMIAYKYKGTMATGTKITLEEGTLGIGESAFSGCSGMTSVIIPNSVTSIGDKAFQFCSRLEEVILNSNSIVSKTYTSTRNISTIFGSQVKKYIFGDNITGIGEYAFPSNTSIYVSAKSSLLAAWNYGISPYDLKTSVLLANPLPTVQTNTASSIHVSRNSSAEESGIISSESITVAGVTITKIGHTTKFTGLTPNTAYTVAYNSTIKYAGSTFSYSNEYRATTNALTLTTSQPKVISAGNVVVGAVSNLDDAEENAGFEWRRTDWTDDFKSNTGVAYLYEGTMEGYIRNLYTEKLWKVRPYYKSNSGNLYYGDWVGIDPTNTSYFEPTVHTYAKINVDGNRAQLSGYVQRGSDEVRRQGFMYWISESGARVAADAGLDSRALAASAVPSSAKTIEAEGRVMEVELTGLKPNTTYAYVAFVTTTEGETFYGKQLSFTTGDDPEASVTGDANGNGVVEIGDVTSVLTLMATPEATGYDNKAADANGNGVIEIGDVTTILTIMAKGE